MRISTSIVLFYIWLTASANLVESTGIASAMGVSTGVSMGESFDEAINALGNISGGGGLGESLIGIYTALSNSVDIFLIAFTAGPRVLVNLGLPPSIVAFIHAPLGLITARLGVYVLSERDL